jgi:hypothetical protein
MKQRICLVCVLFLFLFFLSLLKVENAKMMRERWEREMDLLQSSQVKENGDFREREKNGAYFCFYFSYFRF